MNLLAFFYNECIRVAEFVALASPDVLFAANISAGSNLATLLRFVWFYISCLFPEVYLEWLFYEPLVTFLDVYVTVFCFIVFLAILEDTGWAAGLVLFLTKVIEDFLLRDAAVLVCLTILFYTPVLLWEEEAAIDDSFIMLWEFPQSVPPMLLLLNYLAVSLPSLQLSSKVRLPSIFFLDTSILGVLGI